MRIVQFVCIVLLTIIFSFVAVKISGFLGKIGSAKDSDAIDEALDVTPAIIAVDDEAKHVQMANVNIKSKSDEK